MICIGEIEDSNKFRSQEMWNDHLMFQILDIMLQR